MTTAPAVNVVACPNCGRWNRIPAAAHGNPHCGNCHRVLPWIVEADDANFGDIAEQAPRYVLVDLWATWCGPCRTVSPSLERVATEMADDLKLVKVDIDRSPTLARRFEVQSVPTLLVLRDGEVLARQSGAVPAAALRSWVQTAIQRSDRSP
jgi:thioredoxin 2